MSISEKLTTIAENEQKVYDKGYNDGSTMGYENGYTDGAHYGYNDGYNAGVADQKAVSVDWDIIQQKGARINYTNGFAYWDWEYGDPKYPVAPNAGVYGQSMFLACNFLKEINWDKFDLSKLSTFYNFCMNCLALENIGIDIAPTGTTATAFYQAFSRCEKVKNIQKIVAKTAHQFTGTFTKCYELEEIRFAPYDAEKGIGIANDISFADSPKLTRESIVSILEALADNGKTLTFSTDLEYENKMRDHVFGYGVGDLTAETLTINGLTLVGSGFDDVMITGTSTDTVVFNLTKTPIEFPDIAYGTSLRLYDEYLGCTDYLRATVQYSDGSTEMLYGSSYDIGHFAKGDKIISIDLVIPSGVTLDCICRPIGFIEYLYWMTQNYPQINSWTIVY